MRPLVTTYAEICLRPSCTQLQAGELEILATAFSKQDTLQENGLKISGQKYFTLRLDADAIQLKHKVSPPPPGSTTGLFQLSDARFLHVARWSLYVQDEESDHPRCL